jgi:hypothetical protein
LGLADFLTTNPFPIHGALVRVDALRAAGGFDPTNRAMEDWDLWLRLAANGGIFQAVPGCLARYRLHGTSNSSDPDRMRAGRLRALEKLYARDDLPPTIRAQRDRAYAAAFLQSSVERFAARRYGEALADFVRAVRQYPALLEDDACYYALACAEQPVGYKATAVPIDFPRSARRLMDALALATAELDSPVVSAASVQARGCRVLARLASLQGKPRVCLQCEYWALRAQFGLPACLRACADWAKAVARATLATLAPPAFLAAEHGRG